MKPAKPDSSDCCGSGCTPCVLDVYEAELKKWERGETGSEEGPKYRHDLLSNLRYLPFKIISRASITPDVYLYRFQPFISSEKSIESCDTIFGQLDYKPSQHFIMRCPQTKIVITDDSGSQETDKIAGQQSTEMISTPFISRAYTPISLACEEKNCCFDMIIKHYTNGAISSLLQVLTAGDVIHFRGPYGGFEHNANSYSSITMICAGTGIAPMISVIKSIIADENDETLILLLFTVSTFENIILREDIQHFCRNWNMTTKIYLTKEPNWDGIRQYIRHDEVIINHKITEEVIKTEVLCRENNQILICGPNGFCEQVESWLLSLGGDDVKDNIFIF